MEAWSEKGVAATHVGGPLKVSDCCFARTVMYEYGICPKCKDNCCFIEMDDEPENGRAVNYGIHNLVQRIWRAILAIKASCFGDKDKVSSGSKVKD